MHSHSWVFVPFLLVIVELPNVLLIMVGSKKAIITTSFAAAGPGSTPAPSSPRPLGKLACTCMLEWPGRAAVVLVYFWEALSASN